MRYKLLSILLEKSYWIRRYNNKKLTKKLNKGAIFALDEEHSEVCNNVWNFLRDINKGKYKSKCLTKSPSMFSYKRYLLGLYTYSQIEDIINEYGFELFCTH